MAEIIHLNNNIKLKIPAASSINTELKFTEEDICPGMEAFLPSGHYAMRKRIFAFVKA